MAAKFEILSLYFVGTRPDIIPVIHIKDVWPNPSENASLEETSSTKTEDTGK